MQPERILVVIDGMEMGGSQRQIQHLLNGLDRARWAPELAFFRSNSMLADSIRGSGIPVHYIPKRSRFDLRFLFAYARLLRRRHYALIHAFSLTAELWSVIARPLSRRRPPLVASERSFALDRPRWFWTLKRQVLLRSAAVIANSRAGADATARRTGMPAGMFVTIANGVDLPRPAQPSMRAAIRHELAVPDGCLLGLFVGRLVQVKNLPCLIEALALIPPAQRPCVALAGDGPMRTALETQATRHDVADHLRLLGERTDVTHLLQAADFLVLPSHFEGLSNAVLEAMAAGCPVIASAVGGSPELVDDGRTGLLFAPGDPQALATAILRLSDPALRLQLARAAREYVEHHHGQSALAAATASVYEHCLRTATGRNNRTADTHGQAAAAAGMTREGP